MKKKPGGITLSFLTITIIPMLILGLIITASGSSIVLNSLNRSIEQQLENMSNTVLVGYDMLYPGDYRYDTVEDEIYLYKGEKMINGDFEYIDQIKAETGIDITLCYMQFAVITTLKDVYGNRIVGAGDSDVIYNEVVVGDTSRFYSNVEFGKEDYYAFYTPIHDGNGKVLGMLCILEDSEYAKPLVWMALLPILLIAFFAMLAACFFSYKYSSKLIDAIHKIQRYMAGLAKGDFTSSMDNDVISRSDELGKMGNSAVKTAAALRKLVEEDQLTSLNNRRSAYKHLHNTMLSYLNKGVRFCVAIGDIDFFKKVNDTYGHDGGDAVLIAVSSTIKRYMMGKGYAIRWGGEEFLLIFEDAVLEKAESRLKELLDEVRGLQIVHGENTIKVTMTYGIIECDKVDLENESLNVAAKNGEEYEDLLKRRIDKYISDADARLYYGKEHGRNQIVSHEVP
ncbi:MAG: diguanylate cyclase [Lachnospiraceae bacterium]|nr:diguanylate cyclase [Lachnospiraceae bacterium]